MVVQFVGAVLVFTPTLGVRSRRKAKTRALTGLRSLRARFLDRLRHSIGDAFANDTVVDGQEPTPERALPCSAPARTQLAHDRTCDEDYRESKPADPPPMSDKLREDIKNCTMSEFYALSKVVMEHLPPLQAAFSTDDESGYTCTVASYLDESLQYLELRGFDRNEFSESNFDAYAKTLVALGDGTCVALFLQLWEAASDSDDDQEVPHGAPSRYVG